MSKLMASVHGGVAVRLSEEVLVHGTFSRPGAGWGSLFPEVLSSELERIGCFQAHAYPVSAEDAPVASAPTHVVNACGVVGGVYHPLSMGPLHPAWIRVSTVFGWEHQAYTIAGNVAAQYNRVVFKGATDPVAMLEIVRELLRSADVQLKLHLLVTQTRLGFSFVVSRCCLLEQRMETMAWVKPRDRIEELCNTALFCVKDWTLMLTDLKLDPWPFPPSSAAVSVTRRGIMTLRMTWPPDAAMEWESNDRIKDVGDRLGAFVCGLC